MNQSLEGTNAEPGSGNRAVGREKHPASPFSIWAIMVLPPDLPACLSKTNGQLKTKNKYQKPEWGWVTFSATLFNVNPFHPHTRQMQSPNMKYAFSIRWQNRVTDAAVHVGPHQGLSNACPGRVLAGASHLAKGPRTLQASCLLIGPQVSSLPMCSWPCAHVPWWEPSSIPPGLSGQPMILNAVLPSLKKKKKNKTTALATLATA